MEQAIDAPDNVVDLVRLISPVISSGLRGVAGQPTPYMMLVQEPNPDESRPGRLVMVSNVSVLSAMRLAMVWISQLPSGDVAEAKHEVETVLVCRLPMPPGALRDVVLTVRQVEAPR
jgi:hypothetical protein